MIYQEQKITNFENAKSIMETSLKRIVHLLLLTALSVLTVNAKVISYPAPKGEALSADYTVEVNCIDAGN